MEQHGSLTQRRLRAKDSLKDTINKSKTELYPNLEKCKIDDNNEVYCFEDDDYVLNEIAVEKHVGHLREDSCSDTHDSGDAQDSADSQDVPKEYKDDLSIKSENNNICLKSIVIFIVVILPFIAAYGPINWYEVVMQMQKVVFHTSLNELLDDEFDTYNFIPSKKQLELKQNLIAKINVQSESDPLSIFILHTQHQSTNASRFAQNIGHIFAKHNGGDKNSLLAFPSSQLFSQKYDIESNWDSQLTSVDSIIVQDFTGLTWESAKIFLKYCDNYNAPFKNRLFIFLAISEHCNIVKPDKSIEENLLRVWNVENETIEALIVRISSISMCAI